jgi:hypothetical protein
MAPLLGAPTNPGSAHAAGRAAAAAVDKARAQVAALVGWHREGVIFTGGATEGSRYGAPETGVASMREPHSSACAAAEFPGFSEVLGGRR